MRVRFEYLLLLIGCSGDASAPNNPPPAPPPPPPAPIPLVLSVQPISRKATARPGTTLSSDNAVVALTGDNAATATWVAVARHSWISITSGNGTGNGSVAWQRNPTGLGIGTYVDTITITATGATGSPAQLIDTLQITAEPVPLTLVVAPLSHHRSTPAGTSLPGDNVAITLSGDNASTTTWSASKVKPWTSLTNAAGIGSGTLAWQRNVTGLAVGIYVDTITVVAVGASGSPIAVIDSLEITAPAAPLTLVVAPLSRNRSTPAGIAPPADNVAITLTGSNAATTAWTASKVKPWTTLTNASGAGSGTLAWQESVTGLAVGVYVDTITVIATGAAGSPARVIDTLNVTAAPVPLTLAVTPASENVSVIAGSAAPGGTATVTLAGDNSASTHWSATKKKTWTTLTTASGTGSGTAAWSRSTSGLIAGIYVDTVTVTATGAAGSPARVIDTLIVTTPSDGPIADLGVNTSLHGRRIFPASDPWNQPVDTAQMDPASLAILTRVGLNKSLHPDFGSDAGGQFGYSYVVVPDSVTRSHVTFYYPDQSDPGPYPIPANPPLETGSDRHLFMITQHEWKLYELFDVSGGPGVWAGGSGAIFDMTNGTQRPAGWTSADAAGLPMIPGMVRYDEVYEQGAINHALRFTITHSRRAYVPPATHFASSSTDPALPPMGMRVRLRADFDVSVYPAPMQVILRALKKYAMMVADNGGDFFLSGVTDLRWDNDMNNLLKQVKVSDFEVVKMTGVVSQ